MWVLWSSQADTYNELSQGCSLMWLKGKANVSRLHCWEKLVLRLFGWRDIGLNFSRSLIVRQPATRELSESFFLLFFSPSPLVILPVYRLAAWLWSSPGCVCVCVCVCGGEGNLVTWYKTWPPTQWVLWTRWFSTGGSWGRCWAICLSQKDQLFFLMKNYLQ